MDDALIVANWLGMTLEQAEELKQRLEVLKTDHSGFGSLRIDVKRWQVYRISHVVEGKPVVFNESKGESMNNSIESEQEEDSNEKFVLFVKKKLSDENNIKLDKFIAKWQKSNYPIVFIDASDYELKGDS